VRPGEIVLEGAWRAFDLRGDRGRTLKDLLVRREAGALQTVQALAGVDLHVEPGETVGIVGRNGAGKTSTLRVLAGIVPLHRGRAAAGGRVATLIELGAGFGRDFTGRENIYLNAALHGLDRPQVERHLDEIIAFSELGEFIDVPVKAYSSGMLVRLGFSIAAHIDADVLLIDEVLAVGDEAFQRKCLRRISERIASGATLVLVSHAAGAIERVCDRVVVLESGKVAFDGPTAEGLLFYRRLLGVEREAEPVRPGPDRAVFVEDVELQDSEGRRRESFRAGDVVRLVLGLGVRAGATAPGVEIAIELRDAGGRPLFGTSTPVEGAEPGARVTFEIPRLALLGGDYDIVVAVHEAGDPDPGIDRLIALNVAATPDGQGVSDLRGTWTVEQAVRR
jgi:ABC-type polysaccharide/polyol phosphate transport system ATPase subunit